MSELVMASSPNPVAPFGAPASTRRPGLGRVALVVGALLFVVSVGVSVVIGIAAAPYAEIGPNGFDAMFSASDPDPAVRALAGAMAAHVILGGLIGVGVIVLGIVAVAMNRGRLPGVVAIVFGVITPGISLAVYIGVIFAAVQAA